MVNYLYDVRFTAIRYTGQSFTDSTHVVAPNSKEANKKVDAFVERYKRKNRFQYGDFDITVSSVRKLAKVQGHRITVEPLEEKVD